MSKKFRLLMALVLVIGLFGGLLTGSTVSADPSPGIRFQLPRIDLGDVFGTTPAGDWDTKIQIQNVGGTTAVVTVTFYGPFEGDGEITALGTEVRTLVPNGVWTLHNVLKTQTWLTAESAIVSTPTGNLLAVTVDRWGTDAFGVYEISSSYTGIADDTDMVGPGGPFKYFAPYIMNSYHNLDTTLTIQNSGELATSVWIYYKEEGNCECMKAQHIEVLAPGEAIRVGPGPDADLDFPGADACSPGNGNWLGSAFISANEELGIIVDQLSLSGLDVDQEAVLLTYRGMPYTPLSTYDPDGPAGDDLGHWDTKWYADLLYREISGWLSSIQVQNLTEISQPTFVTVEFFDQSGDSIFFVGDWICRNGAKTFYLPALVDLGVNYPFGYVGAAEIESHAQVDYPGNEHDGAPIFVVVDLKKDKLWDGAEWRHTLAGESQGGSYNAHPEGEKRNADLWAMPYIAKEQNGVTSRIAIRNNANCNKITGRIYIYDETGTDVAWIPVPYLHPKHMKIFDLNYLGVVYPGFVGSAVFDVDVAATEQLCDIDNDGHVDNADYMPSVVVMNYGWGREVPVDPYTPPMAPIVEGDLTRIYEAIPFSTDAVECDGSLYGTVTVRQAGSGYDREELDSVVVTAVGSAGGTTDPTGGYQIATVPAGTPAMTFTKSGFFAGAETPTVTCGDDTQQNFEMICSNPLTVTTYYSASNNSTGMMLPGVLVTGTATYDMGSGPTVETLDYTVTTDNSGAAMVDVAGSDALTVFGTKVGYDRTSGGVASLGTAGHICTASPSVSVTLCTWNSIVGRVTIGGQSAEGYTVEAVERTTWTVADTSVTTSNGVFALDNLSAADSGATLGYELRLYNDNITLIDTSAAFTVDDYCGVTGQITYTTNVWDGPTW